MVSMIQPRGVVVRHLGDEMPGVSSRTRCYCSLRSIYPRVHRAPTRKTGGGNMFRTLHANSSRARSRRGRDTWLRFD
jgi:hypothetical protein